MTSIHAVHNKAYCNRSETTSYMLQTVSVAHASDPDLNYFVSVKIGSIEGDLNQSIDHNNDKHNDNNNNNKRIAGNKNTIIDLVRDPHMPSINLSSKHDDMFVYCELWDKNMRICPPVKTSYRSQHKKKEWREWIVFPVKYCEITCETVLCVTVIDVFSPRKPIIIGSATYALFDGNGFLRMGSHKLKLWPKKVADGRLGGSTMGAIDTQDELTRIELIAQEEAQNDKQNHEWLNRLTFPVIQKMRQKLVLQPKPGELFLNLEFQKFDPPIVFFEDHQEQLKQELIDGEFLTAVDANHKRDRLLREYVLDLDVGKEDPVAKMHLKLSMHLSHGFLDRYLEPASMERKRLMKIMEKTSLEDISPEEKQLFWKYRYWLIRDKRALTKFLRCVDWEIEKEYKEAASLIGQWTKIDRVDALELLSKTFQNVEVVRNYAVTVLRACTDEELLTMLLQLVQALRYEKDMRRCALSDFLIERAGESFELANYLSWYLKVESGANDMNLFSQLYGSLYSRFLKHLQNNSKYKFLEQLVKQEKLVQNLVQLCKDLKANTRDTRPVKIEYLRKRLAVANGEMDSGEWGSVFKGMLQLPIDPRLQVSGIDPSDALIFKSATNPIRLTLTTPLSERKIYRVIFKIGDDLRQDQLIIQIIQVMDGLLRKNGLDLKLTPYNVLACSNEEGFVECVTPSVPFERIVSESGDVRRWLQQQCKNDKRLFEEACDNFVKSCAAYCVITYILGIGDRHLDNLLITPDGKLFHIDFGYILGRDPKRFAPPMKLCKEMVDGMGGSDSESYAKFLNLCCNAYNIFRKSANLIINLFLLMIDANIPDIDFDTNRMAVGAERYKNIMRVQERFRLDLNDPQAMKFMQGVISESEKALFSNIHDIMHRWAQYWRT